MWISYQLGIQVTRELNKFLLSGYNQPRWHGSFLNQILSKSLKFMNKGILHGDKEMKFNLSYINDSLIINFTNSSDESTEV